jgi:hypothetical protein
MGIALQEEPKKRLVSDVKKSLQRLGVGIQSPMLKSLEHHLESFLSENDLAFTAQDKIGILQQLTDFICNQFDSESTALFATARIWDDGIIDPRDTRKIVAECLSICLDANQRILFPNTFGVARP